MQTAGEFPALGDLDFDLVGHIEAPAREVRRGS